MSEEKSFLYEEKESKKLLVKYYPANGHSEYEIIEVPNIFQFSTVTRTFEDLADYFQNAKFKAKLVFDKKLKMDPDEQKKLEEIVAERNTFLDQLAAKKITENCVSRSYY